MAKRKKFSSVERLLIATRAKYRCEYCLMLEAYSPSTFEIEHITPISKGGTNDLANLALACGGCNGQKSDKTTAIDPFTNLEVALFHPRIQIWEQHFEWSDNTLNIVGISPIGRATVELLMMNRLQLVNLRTLLMLAGQHP